MQLRTIIEPAAAELAATHGSEEQLAAIVGAAKEMRTTYLERRVAAFIRADLASGLPCWLRSDDDRPTRPD